MEEYFLSIPTSITLRKLAKLFLFPSECSLCSSESFSLWITSCLFPVTQTFGLESSPLWMLPLLISLIDSSQEDANMFSEGPPVTLSNPLYVRSVFSIEPVGCPSSNVLSRLPYWSDLILNCNYHCPIFWIRCSVLTPGLGWSSSQCQPHSPSVSLAWLSAILEFSRAQLVGDPQISLTDSHPYFLLFKLSVEAFHSVSDLAYTLSKLIF